jgi:hypothetical protein
MKRFQVVVLALLMTTWSVPAPAFAQSWQQQQQWQRQQEMQRQQEQQRRQQEEARRQQQEQLRRQQDEMRRQQQDQMRREQERMRREAANANTRNAQRPQGTYYQKATPQPSQRVVTTPNPGTRWQKPSSTPAPGPVRPVVSSKGKTYAIPSTGTTKFPSKVPTVVNDNRATKTTTRLQGAIAKAQATSKMPATGVKEIKPASLPTKASKGTGSPSKLSGGIARAKALAAQKAAGSAGGKPPSLGGEAANDNRRLKFDAREGKIESAYAARGWTKEEIRRLTMGKRAGVSVDRQKGRASEPATVYGKRGKYVVVNDKTGQIVQISDKNDKNWKDDKSIIWD